MSNKEIECAGEMDFFPEDQFVAPTDELKEKYGNLIHWTNSPHFRITGELIGIPETEIVRGAFPPTEDETE